MATPSGILTSSPVTTALFIGGKARQTAEKMAIADPAKPGVVIGHAASATAQDVRDAIAAAKAETSVEHKSSSFAVMSYRSSRSS